MSLMREAAFAATLGAATARQTIPERAAARAAWTKLMVFSPLPSLRRLPTPQVATPTSMPVACHGGASHQAIENMEELLENQAGRRPVPGSKSAAGGKFCRPLNGALTMRGRHSR